MEFSLNYALTNLIAGQRRTGRSKQFVFLDGQIVWKGPYTPHRLNNIIFRSQVFKTWQTPHVVTALDSVSCPDGVFVRFNNLQQGYPVRSEPYTEKDGKYNYRILIRSELVKFKDAYEDWIFQNSQLIENIILALSHCHLLSVGDMHFSNMLVNKLTGQVYIIDLDDTLGEDREDAEFYFSMPSGKKYRWLDKVRFVYSNVANRLEVMRSDSTILQHNLSQRLERIIRLLRQHGSVPTASSYILPLPTPTLPPSNGFVLPLPPSYPTPSYSSINEIQNIVSTFPDATGLPIFPSPSFSSSPSRLALLPFTITEQMKQEDKIRYPPPKINLMEWHGQYGGTKTYSGISLDVIVSCIQKYVRRGLFEKAILSCIELYRLIEVGGKGADTRLFNRLAIIACEDIGPPQLGVVVATVAMAEAKHHDIWYVAAVVYEMCKNRKTRIMSHYRRAYMTAEGRQKAMELGVSIDNGYNDDDRMFCRNNLGIIPSYAEHQPQPQSGPGPLWVIAQSGYELEFQHIILMCYRRLEQKDPNFFSWLYFFEGYAAFHPNLSLNAYMVPTVGQKSKDIMDIIWWLLRPYLHGDVLITLYKAYHRVKGRDRDVFLMTGCVSALHRATYQYFNLTEAGAQWVYHRTLIDMLEGKYTLEVDNFCIDKHTKEGKRKGADVQQFVTEGAFIDNPDPEYYNPLLEKVYQSR